MYFRTVRVEYARSENSAHCLLHPLTYEQIAWHRHLYLLWGRTFDIVWKISCEHELEMFRGSGQVQIGVHDA